MLDSLTQFLEGLAAGAIAHQAEDHLGTSLVGQATSLDDVLEVLLGAHVAGVDGDELGVTEVLLAHVRRVSSKVNLDVAPVAGDTHVLVLDAQVVDDVPTEAVVDHQHAGGSLENGGFHLLQQPALDVAAADLPGAVAVEVLDPHGDRGLPKRPRTTWMPVLIRAGLTQSTTSGLCQGLSAAPRPKVTSCRMRLRPMPPEPITWRTRRTRTPLMVSVLVRPLKLV